MSLPAVAAGWKASEPKRGDVSRTPNQTLQATAAVPSVGDGVGDPRLAGFVAPPSPAAVPELCVRRLPQIRRITPKHRMSLRNVANDQLRVEVLHPIAFPTVDCTTRDHFYLAAETGMAVAEKDPHGADTDGFSPNQGAGANSPPAFRFLCLVFHRVSGFGHSPGRRAVAQLLRSAAVSS